jgi:hypothetical protein
MSEKTANTTIVKNVNPSLSLIVNVYSVYIPSPFPLPFHTLDTFHTLRRYHNNTLTISFDFCHFYWFMVVLLMTHPSFQFFAPLVLPQIRMLPSCICIPFTPIPIVSPPPIKK